VNKRRQTKSSLPEEVKQSISLVEALENWRNYRLLRVHDLCAELDDPFRTEFGKVHMEFANSVNIILEEKNVSSAIIAWHKELDSKFENLVTFNNGGPRIRAFEICCAELAQIINLGLT